MVAVEGFSADGFIGDLLLSFINDRLYGVNFYPENSGPYLEWLRAHERRLSKGSQRSTHGVMIRIEREPVGMWPVGLSKKDSGAPVVRWVDQKLASEVHDWVAGCT
jgi:hypothetical protein